MKIYTKTGDKGTTSLLGGTRVPKHHIRVKSYGSVDELNAHIGLLRDHCTDKPAKKSLLKIQNELFIIGSILATDPLKEKIKKNKKTLEISDSNCEFLEREMDKMNENLPKLTHFIIPGGHPTVSHCHIARNVCRRTERIVVELAEQSEVDEAVIKYLNRLSDYLFVLARKLKKDTGAEEVYWMI